MYIISSNTGTPVVVCTKSKPESIGKTIKNYFAKLNIRQIILTSSEYSPGELVSLN